MADALPQTPAQRLQALQAALAEPVQSAAAAENAAMLARRLLLAGEELPPETAAALKTVLRRQERRERFRLRLKRNGIVLAVIAASALLGYGLVILAQSRITACRCAQWERALQAADFAAAEAALAAEPAPALQKLWSNRLKSAKAAEEARRAEWTKCLADARALLHASKAPAAEFALLASRTATLGRTIEEQRETETLRQEWSKARLEREAAARAQAQKELQSLLTMRRKLEKELATAAGASEKSLIQYSEALTAALGSVPPGRDREPLMILFKELPALTARVENSKIKARK